MIFEARQSPADFKNCLPPFFVNRKILVTGYEARLLLQPFVPLPQNLGGIGEKANAFGIFLFSSNVTDQNAVGWKIWSLAWLMTGPLALLSARLDRNLGPPKFAKFARNSGPEKFGSTRLF